MEWKSECRGLCPLDPRNLFGKRLIKNFYKKFLVIWIKRERFRPDPKTSLPEFLRARTDGKICSRERTQCAHLCHPERSEAESNPEGARRSLGVYYRLRTRL